MATTILGSVSRHVAVIAGTLVLLANAAGEGLSNCKCINPYTYAPVKDGANGFGSVLVNDRPQFTPPGSSESFNFKAGWGNGCDAHDKGSQPYCASASSPGWCEAEWCYVDKAKCDGVTYVKSKWFPRVTDLWFSYATCAGSGGSGTNSGPTKPWNDESVQVTKRLVRIVNNYVRGAVSVLEKAYVNKNASAMCPISADMNMAPCNSCSGNSVWGQKIDFRYVGIKEAPAGTAEEKSRAVCMAEEVAQTFTAVAAARMDPDFSKVGYEYFGEAKTGGYAQWPKVDITSWKGADGGEYDPRFRPWYSSGAAGPKDVIILVDVSGSMDQPGKPRHEKAQAATKRILDTLTWKDFVAVILFDGGIEAVYPSEQKMVQATEANKENIRNWCDKQEWAGGQTNFRLAFEEAFRIMESSIRSKRTSMCQKALMFLTDGKDPRFDSSHYEFVKRKSIEQDVTLFSYAIGSGADTTVAKKLACQNRGVFYPVGDDDDLAAIMSSYFEFFVQGQEVCSTTYLKYAAAGTGKTLYSGCMPMYDRTQDTSRSLLGVTCLDVDLISSISEMKQQAGWDHFVCQATDMTKQCRTLDLSECNLQKIRAAVGTSSVCSETEEQRAVDMSQACACIDPACQDDPTFTDAQKYFCDQWVGDDCNAGSEWGYSASEMAEVRKNCKRSCGLCDWVSPCPPATPGECGTGEVQRECRACLGKTSGYDLEGNCMTCPAGSPRDLMEGKQPNCGANSGPSPSPGSRSAVASSARPVSGVLALGFATAMCLPLAWMV